jgi:hypothetical protein
MRGPFPPATPAHNANPAITQFLMFVSSCLEATPVGRRLRSPIGRQTRPSWRAPVSCEGQYDRLGPSVRKVPCSGRMLLISECRRVKRSWQVWRRIPNACLRSANPLRLRARFPPSLRILFPLLSRTRGSADDVASHRQTPVHWPQRAPGCALPLAQFPVARLQRHMLQAELGRRRRLGQLVQSQTMFRRKPRPSKFRALEPKLIQLVLSWGPPGLPALVILASEPLAFIGRV